MRECGLHGGIWWWFQMMVYLFLETVIPFRRERNGTESEGSTTKTGCTAKHRMTEAE